MHNKACLIAAVVAIALLFSSLAVAEEAKPEWGLAGGLGLTMMDDDFFISTSLYPDLSVGKLGVGLELTLNISKDGIRKEDWQPWNKALANSIRYVRWGNKGEPVYVKLGELNAHDVGTGILVGNYTNRSAADINTGSRKLGLVGDVDFGIAGVETLVNDFGTCSLIAGRAYIHPTRMVPALSKLDKLTIGVSWARDKRTADPFSGLQGSAIDAMLPLSSNMLLYAHKASLSDTNGNLGSGMGAGLRGGFGPISFLAEIRKMDAGFVPSPFSKSYEQVGLRPGLPATQGYLLGVGLSVAKGDLVVGLQQEFNALAANKNPCITGSLQLKGEFIKAFTGGRPAELVADYTKELTQGGSNAYLKANAKVGLMRGAYFNFDFDAVIDPTNKINHRTSGGVVFGSM